MKLTKKKVKEDSIKKWEALVNNPLPIRSLEYEKLIKELKVSIRISVLPLVLQTRLLLLLPSLGLEILVYKYI